MDSFEQLIGSIFEKKGHWVKHGFKVNLTKKDKLSIGRHSSPRWEIDVVAYNARENRLNVIECKSYLDSRGVTRASFTNKPAEGDHYKLFNDRVLRRVVLNRLKRDMVASGLCRKGLSVRLVLVAGKAASKDERGKLQRYFKRNGWDFYGDDWIRAQLREISESGYEDNIATVTAKILLR